MVFHVYHFFILLFFFFYLEYNFLFFLCFRCACCINLHFFPCAFFFFCDDFFVMPLEQPSSLKICVFHVVTFLAFSFMLNDLSHNSTSDASILVIFPSLDHGPIAMPSMLVSLSKYDPLLCLLSCLLFDTSNSFLQSLRKYQGLLFEKYRLTVGENHDLFPAQPSY